MTNRNTSDRTTYERDRYAQELQRQNQAIRENDSAASGLVIGVLLTGLAALAIGGYFLTQRPSPSPSRTIIERNTTREVPVPQQQAPDVNVTVPNPEPPRVNITVPSPAPAPAPAQPSTTQPPTDSSTDQSTSDTAPTTTNP